MRVLGQVVLREAARVHADVANALTTWRAAVLGARCPNFAALKTGFPAADYVPPFTVFNIKGNKYRLIAIVDYTEQVVVVREVLTHAKYSRGKWK